MGKRYWRSLDDLTQTTEFREIVAREFPGQVWESIPPASRRQFLKVMGASLALAGLTSCRWPVEEIVPLAHRPEGRDPGVARGFATAMEMAGAACGMVVTSYDGRPIKVEGNPQHPASRGAASALTQAALLEVYDPDRSRKAMLRKGGQEFPKTWEDFRSFAADHFSALARDGGRGFAVLSEADSSPTRARLKAELEERFPEVRWYEYEPISRDSERSGTRMAFGRPLRPLLHLDRAQVVACFDADPLFDPATGVRNAGDFAHARRPERGRRMARLYAAEPRPTISGAAADERLAVPHRRVAGLLLAVAGELHSKYGIRVAGVEKQSEIQMHPEESAFVKRLAEDLAAHQGAALVIVGRRQPAEAHAIAAGVNAALGAVDRTVSYLPEPDPGRPTHLRAIAELTRRMGAGEIGTLVILGGNPVYDSPADVDFAGKLAAVPTTIHLSLYRDETSRRVAWHVPRAHFLESWGDGRAWDGTVTMVQPLIRPLYGGRSAIEVLATILGREPANGYDEVRSTLQTMVPAADFERSWRRTLQLGFVEGSAFEPARVSVRAAGVASAAAAIGKRVLKQREARELLFVADRKVYDGRFANNGWLQELPDPITKVTWGNALEISPATAAGLNVKADDVVRIKVSGAAVELPVYVVPGQADGALAVSVGYGRTASGKVGTGVGKSVFPLRRSDGMDMTSAVEVTPTGATRKLACTQDHWAIDAVGFESRLQRLPELFREATLDAYLDDPEIIRNEAHVAPLFSLWKEHTYEGDQWGMAIDLNTCIGCNACVVACQAENNIPVVGREQVLNGREMHWIRVDRYFRGDPHHAEMVFQPVPCMQCEDAPCEQVCPVAATQHSRDGLNEMVYNRCVGTRYCSNNCPYKVRRFNFFNYQKGLSDIEEMRYNPEVTVRSRGVMEKCTYCVQRIEAARITAKKEGRPIGDGEIVTACQQTCPSRAIVFGNLNDPKSEVSRLREANRAYAMLAELNVRPRTHYLAKVRNRPVGASKTEKETT